MKPEANDPVDETKIIKAVEFSHKESPTFKVVHADGIFGGPTPSGLLYSAFYSQLSPIPTMLKHEINEDGNVGREIARVGASTIVRSMEVGVLMDLNTAKAFRRWLDEHIVNLEKIVKS